MSAVQWMAEKNHASFQYQDDFVEFAKAVGIDLSPVCMPVKKDVIYTFSELNHDMFWGLSGLLADVLLDKFGNDVIFFDKEKIARYLKGDEGHQHRIQVTTSAGGTKGEVSMDFDPQTEQSVLGGDNTVPCMVNFDVVGQESHQECVPLTRVEYAYHLQACLTGIHREGARIIILLPSGLMMAVVISISCNM